MPPVDPGACVVEGGNAPRGTPKGLLERERTTKLESRGERVERLRFLSSKYVRCSTKGALELRHSLLHLKNSVDSLRVSKASQHFGILQHLSHLRVAV